MTTKIRLAIASVTLAAMLGLLCASSARSDGPDKDVAAALIKLAAAVKKGNDAEVKTLAKKLNGMKPIEDLPDFMHLFKPRNKEGMGWGSKEGKNPSIDGLEKKIQEYAKKVTTTDAADPSNEEAGYWIAAMAEIIKMRSPEKDLPGGKTKKLWGQLADQTRVAAVDFAKASAGKKAADINKAADKLNNVCISCHSKFK